MNADKTRGKPHWISMFICDGAKKPIDSPFGVRGVRGLIHIAFPVGKYDLAADCLERFLLFPAITPILVNPGIASVLFVSATTRILLNPGIVAVSLFSAVIRILL